jgi:glycosyltransferase involved in cell wall biosynthesis
LKEVNLLHILGAIAIHVKVIGNLLFDSMKKIAIITTHPIQYNAPLFRLLKSRGNVEPIVFYTWGESVLNKKFDPGFGKEIEWDIPLLDGYRSIFTKNTSTDPGSHHFKGIINSKLLENIQSESCDAVLIYGWAFSAHLRLMRQCKKKLPVFFRGDSNLLDDKPGIKAKLRRLVLRWIYQSIDIALYAGASNRRYFEAAGLHQNQLKFMPHAIDNSRFAFRSVKGQENLSELKNEYCISVDKRVVLFAGKLEDKKDPLLLIKAFTQLNIEGVILVIVGNGVLEQACKALASNNPSIIFISFQNQSRMPMLYAMCDLFVLPSQGPGETWGLALNEAMAAGKAVIASDKCGGAVDLITNGVNGFIFQHRNIEALKTCLSSALKDPENLRAMGIASAERIKQFSLEYQAQAIEGLF